MAKCCKTSTYTRIEIDDGNGQWALQCKWSGGNLVGPFGPLCSDNVSLCTYAKRQFNNGLSYIKSVYNTRWGKCDHIDTHHWFDFYTEAEVHEDNPSVGGEFMARIYFVGPGCTPTNYETIGPISIGASGSYG